MHGGLIQKGRGDVIVITIDGQVVQVLLTLGDVVRGGHDGVVRTAHTVTTLELGVDHVSPSGDVLLVIGDVFVHTLPSGHLHLGAVGDGRHLGADEILTREGAGVDLYLHHGKRRRRHVVSDVIFFWIKKVDSFEAKICTRVKKDGHVFKQTPSRGRKTKTGECVTALRERLFFARARTREE